MNTELFIPSSYWLRHLSMCKEEKQVLGKEIGRCRRLLSPGAGDATHGTIGSEQVPGEWLEALDAERARRVPV